MVSQHPCCLTDKYFYFFEHLQTFVILVFSGNGRLVFAALYLCVIYNSKFKNGPQRLKSVLSVEYCFELLSRMLFLFTKMVWSVNTMLQKIRKYTSPTSHFNVLCTRKDYLAKCSVHIIYIAIHQLELPNLTRSQSTITCWGINLSTWSSEGSFMIN